ncbi:DUF58 domain-containing protein [Agarivorans sp. MS3-6]
MVKPRANNISNSTDSRIHCDYAQLVRLQSQAQSLSLLPRLKAGSVLSGRHQSRFRGRGLNFDELRHYQLGDDIRHLDWKVTLRTGKPHIRNYTEEKDRNVLIWVDQRSSMFFSSIQVMKSVVAAEVAALCAWRVLKDNDRVGFVISDKDKIKWSKAKRSQHDLLAQLKAIAAANQQLSVSSVDSPESHFNGIVHLLTRLKLRSTTLILISDWADASVSQLSQLIPLRQHNDVLAISITDPLELKLPNAVSKQNWVMGNGSHQLAIDSQSSVDKINQQLRLRADSTRQQLAKLMLNNNIPLVALNTSGDHILQFKKMVGGR